MVNFTGMVNKMVNRMSDNGRHTLIPDFDVGIDDDAMCDMLEPSACPNKCYVTNVNTLSGVCQPTISQRPFTVYRHLAIS